MTDSRLDELERELIEQIMMIQRDYQKQIEPYVRRLSDIRALRPAPPFFVNIESLPKALVEQITGLKKDL